MMERITGKLLTDAIKYFETTFEGGNVSPMTIYKRVYSDALVNIITGVEYENKIDTKIIDNFIRIDEDDDLISDAYNLMMSHVDELNGALKTAKADHLSISRYNVTDTYSFMVYVIDNLSEDGIMNGCDGGCIYNHIKDGDRRAIILVECPLNRNMNRRDRYLPLFHELAHAILSVLNMVFLKDLVPDITDEEYRVFDEILMDIISLKHLSSQSYKACTVCVKEMGYEDDTIHNELERICDEMIEIFDKEENK